MAYEFISATNIDFNIAEDPLGIRLYEKTLSKPVYDRLIQAKTNLTDLLLTYPGERTGEWATYGCKLRELIFEPSINDSDLKSLVVDYIVDAVDAWLPNINLVDIEVTTADDDPTLNYAVKVSITYNVNEQGNGRLQLNVSDSGTITV